MRPLYGDVHGQSQCGVLDEPGIMVAVRRRLCGSSRSPLPEKQPARTAGSDDRRISRSRDALHGLGKLDKRAFPETHPEAQSPGADLDNLKRKFDAGATRAITQFFFDVPVYLDFVERARKAGINQEIVPGILPVTNFGQMALFAKRCGASVPEWLARLFDGLDHEPATRELVAATVAARQCTSLKAEGIRSFHFFTLNRSNLTVAVCRLLGLHGKPAPDPLPLTSAIAIENGARAVLEVLRARQ